MSFDFWEHDKFAIEYMLDRCIIAKMIEGEGHHVPDRFSIYFDGPYEQVDSSAYFDSLYDFITLTKLGVFKYRDLDNEFYTVDGSIRLYALEQLERYPLSEEDRKIKASWAKDFDWSFEMFDHCMIEGKFNLVGSYVFIRTEYATGRASEICDLILGLHHRATAMIKKYEAPKGRDNK